MIRARFDIAPLKRTLASLYGREALGKAFSAGCRAIVNKTAEWICRRSEDRHKTANRLGATPTGILQFTHGDGSAKSKGGGKIYYRRTGDRASMYITGIPFINRAFRSITVKPKRTKYLTVPMHRDAYATRARDVGGKGWKTFFRKGRGGKLTIAGQKGGRGKVQTLYLLIKSAHLKRDAQLLPPSHLMDRWACKAIADRLGKGR